MQNARAANMPKDKVENAIKKASGQGGEDYAIVMYEGYGPHGVAVMVETATDNNTRTVANVRMHFKEWGGNMGNTGSVAHTFKRMCVFKLNPEGIDQESLELDLIDHGLQEMGEGTGENGETLLVVRGDFKDFGALESALTERKLDIVSAESEYIAQQTTELPEAQANEVLQMIDALEQDDDVQKVFHNLA
jgi:YebC/PmpR family DNA-binding regulatory protein